MKDVVTLKYLYNFDGEYEIIEKQALVITPSTVVTANGECVSIEVIKKNGRERYCYGLADDSERNPP